MCDKKLKIFLVVLLFLFILCISNNCFGYEQTYDGNNFIIPDEIIKLAEQTEEYSQVGTDYSLFLCQAPDRSFFITFLPQTLDFYFNGIDTIFSPYYFTRTSYIYDENFNFIRKQNWYDNNNKFLVENNNYHFWFSKPVYTNESFTEYFFEPISPDSFTLSIDTPIENLVSGEYEELVASCNSRFDIIDFTIKVADDFSGQDISQMPILNRCFADFSNNSFINEKYITKYLDKTVIRMPLIDILPKDNTFYYIYFYVHDTVSGEFFDMFYEYTTHFSEAGIANIDNIIKANPNKDIINSLNNGFVALEEQNKSILEKIEDIFNLFNPLDDRFFLYQAINKLIIPSDNFFNNWIADINTWLGDRFGLIYYPIELVIDFLTRIGDIQDSGNYIISWPNLDIFGETLIAAGSYDFNSLLTTQEFNNLHEIYLLIMDVIFYLLLVLFAKNAAAEVFGGRFSDEVIGDIRQYRESHKPNDSYKRNKIGFSTK